MPPGPVRAVRPAMVAGATVLAGLTLGGCGWSFGAPDAASTQGQDIHDLYRWFAAAALGVGVLVSALIAFALVRFRRRSDEVPRQTTYNIPWEVAYTVTPVLIVAALFSFSTWTAQGLQDQTDDPDLTVEVIGFQWQWQFRYPEADVVITGAPDDAPVLVLPLGRTTRLDLVTTDVIHSFWVPRFLQKQDMIPNVDNSIDVTPTELGEFHGHCAEFCGLDHARMNFSVLVLEGDEFDEWLAAAGEEDAR